MQLPKVWKLTVLAALGTLTVACTGSSPSTSSPSPEPTPSRTVGTIERSPRLDYYVPMIRGLARQVSFGDVHRLYVRTDICEGAAEVLGRHQEPCRDAFTAFEQIALANRLHPFADEVRFVSLEDESELSRRGDRVIVWVGPADRRHGDVFIAGGAWTGSSGQGGTYMLESREDGWVFGDPPSGSFWIT